MSPAVVCRRAEPAALLIAAAAGAFGRAPRPPDFRLLHLLLRASSPTAWPFALQSWRLMFTKRYSPMLIITVLVNMFQQVGCPLTFPSTHPHACPVPRAALQHVPPGPAVLLFGLLHSVLAHAILSSPLTSSYRSGKQEHDGTSIVQRGGMLAGQGGCRLWSGCVLVRGQPSAFLTSLLIPTFLIPWPTATDARRTGINAIMASPGRLPFVAALCWRCAWSCAAGRPRCASVLLSQD